MKKIAFFVQHMLCGGVENALISLSTELNKLGNEVTIYVIEENGDFITRIPEGVKLKKIQLPKKIENILPVGGSKISIRKNIKEHNYIRAAIILKNYFFGKTEFAELNVDFSKIDKLDEEYDIAVNFHIHSPFLVRYLSEKVSATKKLSWIHNDFTTTNYNIKILQPYLECCDAFFAVSKKLVDEFTTVFPEYEEITSLALNLVPVEQIEKKSLEEYPEEYSNVTEGYLKLLSVGRLEAQKGYDLTISVCKKLVEDGYKFKWFILGEGSERHAIEVEIEKQGLKDILCPIGIRMNPYPYFKNCDIYVQTSRHEGYVTTVTEAKIFNRPIVCTDVAGAREQIIDGISGDITDISVDSIYEKLLRLFKEPNRRNYYTTILANDKNVINVDYMKVFEK